MTYGAHDRPDCGPLAKLEPIGSGEAYHVATRQPVGHGLYSCGGTVQ